MAFSAQVVELVDTLASGASARKGVEVRVFFWAPFKSLRAPNHGAFCVIAKHNTPIHTPKTDLFKRLPAACLTHCELHTRSELHRYATRLLLKANAFTQASHRQQLSAAVTATAACRQLFQAAPGSPTLRSAICATISAVQTNAANHSDTAA